MLLEFAWKLLMLLVTLLWVMNNDVFIEIKLCAGCNECVASENVKTLTEKI